MCNKGSVHPDLISANELGVQEHELTYITMREGTAPLMSMLMCGLYSQTGGNHHYHLSLQHMRVSSA